MLRVTVVSLLVLLGGRPLMSQAPAPSRSEELTLQIEELGGSAEAQTAAGALRHARQAMGRARADERAGRPNAARRALAIAHAAIRVARAQIMRERGRNALRQQRTQLQQLRRRLAAEREALRHLREQMASENRDQPTPAERESPAGGDDS